MTMRQKATTCAAVSLLALAIGWVAWATAGPSTERAPETPDVSRLPVCVQRAHLVSSILRPRSFTGTLVAARTSSLSFERPGRIEAVLVDEGDRVEAGQPLARLDVGQVAAQLDAAGAAVAQAEAYLRELENGPRPETIAAAKARVASLAADEERLSRSFARATRLLKSNSISTDKHEAARFEHEAAIYRRDAAAREFDELLAGTRAEQLVAQRATLRQLTANRRSLELDLQDGTLFAPYTARVTQRFLDEGTVVTAGTPVLEIVEKGPLEAWVGVPPTAAADLVIDQTYEGRIGDIACRLTLQSRRLQLDPLTRTQNCVFSVAVAHGDVPYEFVPGDIVRLDVPQAVRAEGIVVPSSALVPAPRGLWAIYAVTQQGDNWVVEQRDVTLIETLGTDSFVSGTIHDGMLIIVDGVHRVTGGQLVRVRTMDDVDDSGGPRTEA